MNRPEATVIFHKEIKLIINDPIYLTLTREFDTPCAVPAKEVYRGYKLLTLDQKKPNKLLHAKFKPMIA